jgi:hypothetical protein
MLWHEATEQAGDKPAVEYLHDLARERLSAVPVGGPGRPDAHTASLTRVAAEDKLGAVLRLDPQDLENPDLIGTAVDRWLTTTALAPADVDLVVDLGPVTPTLRSGIALGAAAIVPTLPHLDYWRTFTLASGAFPEALSEIGADSTARLERADWRLWQSVCARKLPRTPAFGDYAVGHPDLLDPDPRKIKFSAAIRFAAASEWVIVKGRSIEKGTFAQFHALSDTASKLPEYEWNGPCDGCAFIYSCAGGGGPGNLTSWREVATVHHLTLTAAQLANLP